MAVTDVSLGFQQLLSTLLSGGCAPTGWSLTLQQDSGEPRQKHWEFTSHFELFWGDCWRKPFTLADFSWSQIQQCIPQFKKPWGGQTCSDGGWVYNGGEKSCGQANSVCSSYRAGDDLHKDVSSAGETGSWAKGLPSSCSGRPGLNFLT